MSRRFDPALLPESPDFEFELALWGAGFTSIAGIDEAGRGSLAGPVAAAAVIFPPDIDLLPLLEGVRDSKELTPALRETWAPQIKGLAFSWGVGFASPREIDDYGIVFAVALAAHRALAQLTHLPDYLLLDYITLPEEPFPQTALIKGDARSLSIASASILAKTARDSRLCELDLQYPGYLLAENKGYCTAGHLLALEDLGPSPVHRMSYAPVRLAADQR